jgi:hypothetical protein
MLESPDVLQLLGSVVVHLTQQECRGPHNTPPILVLLELSPLKLIAGFDLAPQEPIPITPPSLLCCAVVDVFQSQNDVSPFLGLIDENSTLPNRMPDLTRADDSDSLSELIIACSDNTMSDRMPDILSAVIESPNDDTMSRVINPDTMSNLMSDVLRITDSWPVMHCDRSSHLDDSDRLSNLKDSDRSSHLNNSDRLSPFEKPDSLSDDTSDMLSHFEKPDSSSDDNSDRLSHLNDCTPDS